MPRLIRTCLAVLTLLAAGLPAGAETPLTPEEFESLSVGRTFYYDRGGLPFGVEQYLPDRKVVWAFTGDDCREGEWFAEGNDICFTYVDEPVPQCWNFFRTEQGLIARYRGGEGDLPLVMVEDSPAPMACLGPNVGV